MDASKPLCLAYYCSGHGYGHATRVSAFASHLLSLEDPPIVYIISSAPKQCFATSLSLGARYRYADIDPVITQPLAYRVDRQKSVDVLEKFLMTKDVKIMHEVKWLTESGVDCVLSDAAFLAFLAADKAQLPSILVTNFTFDSIYSLLSATFVDQSRSSSSSTLFQSPHLLPQPDPDIPIPEETMLPLVQQIFDGYRHADLLLRLPGAIPIPSFFIEPALPAPQWIDPDARAFKPAVAAHLIQSPVSSPVHPSLSFSSPSFSRSALPQEKPLPRTAVAAPMLVRIPSDDVYTDAGRARVLASIGVPRCLHDPQTTKILIVSFGGQIFHKPSRSGSRTPSRPASPGRGTPSPRVRAHKHSGDFSGDLTESLHELMTTAPLSPATPAHKPPPPIFTSSLIRIPGAPAPAAMPSPTVQHGGFPAFQSSGSIPIVNTIPPTPNVTEVNGFVDVDGAEAEDGEETVLMLPDASWIAIVCGVADSKEWRPKRHTPGAENGLDGSKENVAQGNGGKDAGEEDGLPEGFYIAPKDVYMPDLMAVGDVLLGKLGYGTVSECVDSCTPFVYVSRPLFVEEHGLRLYLTREGTGVEMAREQYEAGDWAGPVAEAWLLGEQRKLERRRGMHAVDRRVEGGHMAAFVVDWVRRWQRGMGKGTGEVIEAKGVDSSQTKR
ncbi:hypothetical protein FA95DRAFT_1675278 [Auriscalpium vulgare]|uniref:Uncharacterized protein n=1 Tax=Auriscalpium vulgare TaxID=40419 RepID=A0ACB8S703_9AGAM|nr:hypothetical protein FA95DRAFT_1675278 [Auriscalpium vulgare]